MRWNVTLQLGTDDARLGAGVDMGVDTNGDEPPQDLLADPRLLDGEVLHGVWLLDHADAKTARAVYRRRR